MPSSCGPLAAQSRDEPEPYSLPARIDQRDALGLVPLARRRRSSSARRRAGAGSSRPSVPGASWFRRRMLANVPRTITSSLPRRAPYELKSATLDAVLDQVAARRAVAP